MSYQSISKCSVRQNSNLRIKTVVLFTIVVHMLHRSMWSLDRHMTPVDCRNYVWHTAHLLIPRSTLNRPSSPWEIEQHRQKMTIHSPNKSVEMFMNCGRPSFPVVTMTGKTFVTGQERQRPSNYLFSLHPQPAKRITHTQMLTM